jgi:hypothetical protein
MLRTRAAGLGLILALAFGLSCTPGFLDNNQADVILRIAKITGTQGSAGAAGGEESDFLNSDVDPVFNDNATLSFEVLAKNPNVASVGLFNDVTLERYEVRYFRSDGRNQEGVDVPYRITGPMATLVPAGSGASAGTGSASIVVVRHQAKIEPPLLNLQSVVVNSTGSLTVGGAGILTCIAEITVHGRTTSGKVVSASGRLQINFANFADSTPTSTPTP